MDAALQQLTESLIYFNLYININDENKQKGNIAE